MKRRFAVLFLIPVLLLAGVFIYASQRSGDLYLNLWLSKISDGRLFTFLQSIDGSYPAWVVYSLPDGLWMAALIMLILVIWDFTLNCQSWLCLGLAIVFGLLMEILQSAGMVPGTFDMFDILCLCLGAVLPVFFTTLMGRKETAIALSANPLNNR
jgi:hypothetical protein